MTTEHQAVPRHLGIIMDGNGRWAHQQGLPRWVGHQEGVDNIKPILECCVEVGISYLTLYSFSTENWERPPDEVSGLMMLVSYFVRHQLDELNRNGVQIRHSGRLDEIHAHLRTEIQRAVTETSHNDRIILNVAFNYGGRDEIVHAIRQVMQTGLPPGAVTETVLRNHLYHPDLPDLDFIIRTGGEFRLSNFMLWQAAYTEYYATDTYWPAFGPAQLHAALAEFNRRERRFGRTEDWLAYPDPEDAERAGSRSVESAGI